MPNHALNAVDLDLKKFKLKESAKLYLYLNMQDLACSWLDSNSIRSRRHFFILLDRESR